MKNLTILLFPCFLFLLACQKDSPYPVAIDYVSPKQEFINAYNKLYFTISTVLKKRKTNELAFENADPDLFLYDAFEHGNLDELEYEKLCKELCSTFQRLKTNYAEEEILSLIKDLVINHNQVIQEIPEKAEAGTPCFDAYNAARIKADELLDDCVLLFGPIPCIPAYQTTIIVLDAVYEKCLKDTYGG